MQKFYPFGAMLLLALTLLLPFPCVTAQGAIFGTGFANGFSDPATDAVPLDPSAGGSRILITQANGTGNQFFRFAQGMSSGANQFGPANCQDQDWSGGEGFSYDNMPVCNQFGAFFINVQNQSDFFVFKTPSVGGNSFIYFQFPTAPAEVVTVARIPADDVIAENMPVTVAAQLNGEAPTDQEVYLRYTTDGFATSTVVEMAKQSAFGIFGATATIPGQPDGTTVEYYVFTSGDTNQSPAADGSDADYRTINLNNNGGSNYSYTVSGALPVTLASFTGRREKNNVALAWTTSSEDAASHFGVECSADGGRSWMTRGQVAARNTAGDYRFTDGDVPAVALDYRLRQVDLDGSFEYSEIITLAAREAGFSVYPQPGTMGEMRLTVSDEAVGSEAVLLDAGGREVSRFTLTATDEKMPETTLAPGIYFLRVGTDVRRVVVR